MSEIKQKILKFRTDRNWKKFHNNERLAAKLSIEAAEVQELFEWGKNPDKERLSEELADVRIILEYLAYDNEINLDQATEDKIKKNAIKYPILDYPEWKETK